MRFAYVNCANLPEPDPDERTCLKAFADAGHTISTLPWDGPPTALGEYDALLIRATWNYIDAPEAFLDWVRRAASQTLLLNPPDVVEWNLHKSYLNELEAEHVPVVPTAFVSQANEMRDEMRFDALMARHGWTDVVIKPTVSAGSWMTRRFRADEAQAARSFLQQSVQARDTMVQRYEPSVERGGERSLVWFGGTLQHVVVKAPRFADGEEAIQPSSAPTTEDRQLAQQILAAAARRLQRVEDASDLLYARIDVIEGPSGEPLLSELELIEPSLFFDQNAGSADRFVQAAAAMVQRI